MKSILKKAVLASAGLALVSTSALAQTPTYSDSDVLLSFRKAGSLNDLIVDLGSVSAFTQTSSFDLSTKLFNDATLLNVFGGSLNGVVWSVWAGNGLSANNQNYLSSASSAGWTGETLVQAKNVNSAITSYGGNNINPAQIFSTQVPGNPTAYTAPTSSAFSFTTYQGNAGQVDSTFAQGSTDIGNGTTFGTIGYFTDITGTKSGGSSVVLGDFTFNALTGDGMWNGADVAVPESGAYGVLAGAGLLALSLRRQFVRKTA
jgi:hypothetical protein